MRLDKEQFMQPGAQFSEAPLWTWNDRLDDTELLRQLEELDRAGWRGFFIHPRPGLITPYLSAEWMDKVKLVVEHAARRGMQAWIYDENVCPSGFADGIVPAQDPSFRIQGLVMRVCSRPDAIHEGVATFACRLHQGQVTDVVRHDAATHAEPGQSYLQFCQYRASIGTRGMGGMSTIDVLNPRAVEAFIASTYAPYAEVLQPWLGTVVPGFFADEISYATGCEPALPVVPWTDRFPDEFARTNGYDIRESLPSLFFDVGEYARVRFDYWHTLCEMFVQTFTRRIYDWCDARGLAFTGHVIYEDTLTSQIERAGACMRHYEYQHIPGLDHIGGTFPDRERTARSLATLLTAKQPSSVAAQMGRQRVFCEAYACSGEEMSFEDRKWVGDWLAVLGVNFFDPHLALYSLRGARKRDCPPVLFFQQPWWQHHRLISDYFTRVSYALSAGAPVASVLVLHPIGSAWAAYTPLNGRACDRLNARLEQVMATLLRRHRDFDLGDESLLQKYGRVEGASLVVGEARYLTVVMPPSTTWTRETVTLLRQFVDGGGVLIAVEPLPTQIHGAPTPDLEALLSRATIVGEGDARCVCRAPDMEVWLTRATMIGAGDASAWSAALARTPAEVEIIGPGAEELWYRLRRDDRRQILFLAQTNRDRSVRATISLAGTGALEEWDLLTGDTRPVHADCTADRTVFQIELPPVGSRLLVLDEARTPVDVAAPESPTETRAINLDGAWAISRPDPNVLNLDVCTYRLDDDEWSEPLLLCHAGKQIAMAGPGTRFAIRLTAHSALEADRHRDIRLVTDATDDVQLIVNGQVVRGDGDGWWVDPSFRTISIGAWLHPGANSVEMRGMVGVEVATPFWEVNDGIQVDACYLIGEFGVRSVDGLQFELTAEPDQVTAGDLTQQGYPFYTGTMRLTRRVNLDAIPDRAVLELVGLHATLAIVMVNDRPAGSIFVRPHQVEITHLLETGDNTIEIALVGTLANLIGPLHDPENVNGWVMPSRFFEGGDQPRVYSLVPFGFETARVLVSS